MATFDQSRIDRIGAVGRALVNAAKLPCAVVQVADTDGPVYHDACGWADVESATPITADSIFRIYSMTKPITSIVFMQLFEEGRLLLEDPVEAFLPEFSNPQVMVGGDADNPVTRPAGRSITVRDLLTHTSGLTYGFHREHPVDARYRAAGLGDVAAPTFSLSEGMTRLGAQPLLFEPGTAWNYSMSTDVCGAIIESITGQTLAQAMSQRVFEPLEMVDTGFSVPESQRSRFTSLYTPAIGDDAGDSSARMARADRHVQSRYLSPPAFLSGGAGLVSTVDDYQRFVSMLLAGGTDNGHRIIGRRTLEYMASNHLPGGALINDIGRSLYSEVTRDGVGFGLGFSVVVDPLANGTLCSVGEYAWGGAASTTFWVDPVEELTVIFMTQLLPSLTYPIRRQLRNAVYQALV